MNRILKARIIEKFGTQADFAQETGLDEPLISRVIHGRVELDQEAQEKWAETLKSKMNDLF